MKEETATNETYTPSIRERESLHKRQLHQMNTMRIAHMNRADRRHAERLVQKGYDDERMALELRNMSRRGDKPSATIRGIRWILRRLSRPGTYYAHLPKNIRPMVSTGNVKIDAKGNRHTIMVADHVKCEKARRKVLKRVYA